jgi:hypothetical protein
MGGHSDRAGTDRQLVRTAVDIDGSDHPPAAKVDPGDGAVERVGSPHGAGRDGDTGGAAADPDWQAGVAKGAMLVVRCWMGYCWSKKVRTSALKRAGCSMFEA